MTSIIVSSELLPRNVSRLLTRILPTGRASLGKPVSELSNPLDWLL